MSLFLLLSLAGCGTLNDPPPSPTPPPSLTVTPAVILKEQPIVKIALAGPMASPEAEISSMAWYQDNLILMPQYPNRFGDALYTVTKREILAILDGDASGPLTPRPIPFTAPGLTQMFFGYEGLEGIEFYKDRVFITIETRPAEAMQGHLLTGRIQPDLSEIRMDLDRQVTLAPQSDVSNMTDEAILVVDGKVITIYEANGVNVNPDPVAHLFDLDLNPLGTVAFPNIEYRINDATTPDKEGRFWVINYFWPGDQKLQPISDPLVARYGTGPSHSQTPVVERLLYMQLTDEGIVLVDQPPIQLRLMGGIEARNWEGLVRLDNRGFLLVTDKHPETILAFVSLP